MDINTGLTTFNSLHPSKTTPSNPSQETKEKLHLSKKPIPQNLNLHLSIENAILPSRHPPLRPPHSSSIPSQLVSPSSPRPDPLPTTQLTPPKLLRRKLQKLRRPRLPLPRPGGRRARRLAEYALGLGDGYMLRYLRAYVGPFPPFPEWI